MFSFVKKNIFNLNSRHYNKKNLFQITKRYMKIYTKTGDKGKTSLYTGARVAKSDQTFAALGDLDQLNANLGLIKSHFKDSQKIPKTYSDQIVSIQCRLIDLGSHIATPIDSGEQNKVSKMQFDQSFTLELEKEIDRMGEKLPPLKNFILPGGSLQSSSVHVARAVCRRCQRSLVKLFQDEKIAESALKFINRLSDYLFMLSRTSAFYQKDEQAPYQKGRGLLNQSREDQQKK